MKVNLTIALLALSAVHADAYQYAVFALPTASGLTGVTATTATCINNSNVAVGYWSKATGSDAARWSITATGSPLSASFSTSVLTPPTGYLYASANGINNSGEIVGQATGASSFPGTIGFYRSALGTASVIPTFVSGSLTYVTDMASSISDNGGITGWAHGFGKLGKTWVRNDQPMAFYGVGAATPTLMPTTAVSMAFIGSAGYHVTSTSLGDVVVGGSAFDTGGGLNDYFSAAYAFAGATSLPALGDIYTSGWRSTALGSNASTMVGWVEDLSGGTASGPHYPFYRGYGSGATTHVLSTSISGELTAINSTGTMVGWMGSSAIICTPSGTYTDLNTQIDPSSGWTLYRANSINDNGWLVGTGWVGGVPSAFVLVPTP